MVANKPVIPKKSMPADISYHKSKVDDGDETILIADLRSAFHEIPKSHELYKKIYEYLDIPFNQTASNIKGIIEKDLPFYDKYVQGTTLHTIMKSITNKIIDNNISFTVNSKEFRPYLKTYKDIVNATNSYGRVLINIIPSSDIKDVEFQIIEPYRYHKTDYGYQIITILPPVEYGNHGEVPVFSIYSRELRPTGVANYTQKYVIVDGKIIEFGMSEVEYINSFNLYEFTTEDGKSIIEPIRNELFTIDMVDTAIALEVKGTQFSIHMDERYFEDGQVRKADVYRIYSDSDGAFSENKPLFEPYQPNIRDANYINIKSEMIKSMATDLGMSANALGFVNVVEQVATSAIKEEEKTVESINSFRSNMRDLLQDMLSKYYNITVNLPQYYSQSIEGKADVVNKLTHVQSTKQRVSYLYPEKTEDEQALEVALVKYENNVPLLDNDKVILQSLGYIEEDKKPDKVVEEDIVV